MNEINHIISKFRPVSLSEIEEVKLMDRIDRKYWFHVSYLPFLLEETLCDYDVLEIDGNRIIDYKTIYYDTPDDSMYLMHHNGKMNRYKIRRRKYISTGGSFLEVKLKTNKKITIKTRIEASFEEPFFLPAELSFIQQKTIYSGQNLKPVLNSRFSRITLIHKDKLDRCTIDMSPVFGNENRIIEIPGLVIFELKRGRNLKSSPVISILRQLKIRKRGLSKYCTGRALLEKELKQNAFKPRLRYIYNQILN